MIENDYEYEKIKKLKKDSFKEIIYSSNNIKKYESCPHCGCHNFIKYGKYHGIQRYRCKNEECKKTFSNTTNSVWKYLKHNPEKWFEFIELMGQGVTLMDCSYILKISVVTAFYWRHKILHAVEKSYKPKKFKKTVSVQSYNIVKCYKGSRNKHYTYEQKFKNKIDKMYGRIPRDVRVLFAQEEHNLPLINRTDSNSTFADNLKENVVTITGKKCYMHKINYIKSSATKLIIEHNKKLPRSIKKKYGFKICNKICYYDMQDNIIDWFRGKNISGQFRIDSLACWMCRFKGVATKYINHYYSFYSLIDSHKKFDYISIFFYLLKNGTYTSIDNLILLHPENY